MKIIDKINNFLFGESPLKFFFSYDGTIGRLKYFGGSLVLNLLIFGLNRYNLGLWAIPLNLVMIYAGFALVQKRCRDINTLGTFYIAALAFTNILVAVKETVVTATMSSAVEAGIAVLVMVGVVCNLILIFRPRAKEISVDMKKRSPLLRYPAVAPFVIFAVIFGISYFCSSYLNKYDENVISAATVLYRHEIGYKKYCAGFEYEMTVYPQKFAEAAAAEKDYVSAEIAKKGHTLEEAYQELEKFIAGMVYNDIRAEFYDLRRAITIYAASEQSGLPPEEIEWNEEMERVTTDKDICALFDETAGTMDFNENGGYLMLKKYVDVLRAK